MPRQMFRSPERSVALRARVVSALLVYRAHMRPQMVRLPESSVALRARVSARLKLFHHPVAVAGERSTQFCRERSEKHPCGNVKCSVRMDLRAAPLHSQDADAAIQLSFIDNDNVEI